MTVGEPRNGKDIMYDAVSGACAGMLSFYFAICFVFTIYVNVVISL